MKASMKLWIRGAAVASLAALSACSSNGGDTDMSAGALLSGGRDVAAEQVAAQRFAAVSVCPEIQVRDGTQLLRIFERGKEDDLTAVRFQGSVQKFARECRTDGSTGATSVRIGVAGRLLAGPSGATGTVTLPVRVVVVRNGDDVIYSKIFKVPATIAPGTSAATWAQVAEDVVIPADRSDGRFVIYVGFDEGKPTS